MIALLEQNVIDMLPLRRETEPAGGQPLIEAVVSLGMFCELIISTLASNGVVNIWNNSNSSCLILDSQCNL